MKTKFLLFSLMLSLLSITNVWADDTYTLGWGTASGTAGTYTNFTANTGSVTNVVSFSTAKNSSQTAPAYNSNNSDLRLYYNSGGNGGSITLTPASGVTITGFVMTSSTTPSVKYKVNGGTAISVTPSSSTYTVSGISATSSLEIQNVNTSNTQLRIKTIQISYTTSGGGKTLSSIAVSGTPTTDKYEVGDAFNPAGLTVTGTYSDQSTAPITEGITWTACKTEAGSYIALDNEAVALAENETEIFVKATAGGKTSPAFHVTGLTVSAAAPKITITATSSGISTTYGDDSFEQNEVTFSYTQWMKSTGFIQAKKSTTGSLKNTTAIPGIIKSITVVTGEGKDARAVTVNGGAKADDLSAITAPATSMSMKFDFGDNKYYFFELNTPGNACYFDKIIIEYEEAPAVSSIAIKTAPTKTTYMPQENFDPAGLVLTVSYEGGSSEDVAYIGNEDKFSFSGFDSSTAAAAQPITVTYGGKTTKFNVEILDVTLQSVTVSGTPTTLSYTAGDTFNPAGLIVTGHYSDNSDAVITSGITWSYPDANSVLAYEQTSIRVVATVDEIASAAYTVSGLTVAAAPLVASWVASEQGYSDQTDMTEQTITFGPSSNFSLVFAKGTNSNAPKYYNSGTAVRAYGGNTFTLSSTDYKFTQIVITFGSGDGSNEISANVGTYEAGTWTGKSKEVTFTIGGTTGNRRIASVTVTYEEALPSAATPTFSVEAGTYFEAQNVTITTTTEGATIYYTTDGTEPTTESSVYTDPIAVSTDMTIKALAAKDGMDNSAVASATYIMGPIFTSLEDLVAADLSSNTMVKVSFSNVAIKTIDSNKKYVTFDIQKEDKDIEIYYNAATLPTNWVVDGTLSGTILAPWKRYPATGTLNCWELAPEAGWAWTELTYSSPIVKTIDHVTVSGTATKTAYIDGEVFDPTGLVVTLYYTDETNEVVTDGITWAPATALTVGMTSVDVTATVENVISAVYPVTISVSEIPNKTIDQFITNQGGRCYLVGVVSNFANSNKNATLTDNSGSILLYNISKNGEVSDFVTLGVEEGDRIKVIATTYQLFYEKDEVVAPEFVEKLAPEVVPVTGVTLPATASVKKGKTVALTATIEPALATDKAVSWSSNAEGVATVDENGVVTGVAEGTANITVTTHDGDFEAICTVTVAEGPDFAHGDWMLVTDVAELSAGSYVIIAAAEYNKAMKPYVSGNNCQSNDATKSGSMITYDSKFGIFEVQAGTKENTIALFDEDNSYYLYAASGSSNHLKGKAELDDNGSWAVSIADGVATLTAQGTNTRNIIKYNAADDQQLFSCYASTSTNMKAIALYKYYAPVPKAIYNKNTEDEVTNMPGATRAESENNEYKVTISTAAPHRSGFHFAGWKDSENHSYTAGTEYSITENITLYAQWEALSAHHVTYVTVGTAPTDDNSYYEGDQVTLASANGLSNPGYVFSGWNDGTQVYAAGYKEYEMPDNDVTFTAVWSRMSNQKWVLVENVADLKTDGTKYIIAGAEHNAAMSELSGSFYSSVGVSKEGKNLKGPEMTELTFEAGSEGTLAIKHGSKYVYSTSAKSIGERDEIFEWTISIAEGVATIDAGSAGTLQYNSGNPRFTTYKTNQQPVAIYIKAASVVVNDAETVDADDLTTGTDVTVKDGGVLNVDANKQIGDLYVEEGGKVALASNKLTVVGRFVIETTMAGGQSGQLTGATADNIAANEAYIDITFGAGATSAQWHAFTVPFPVDALNGIYDLDGNKLKNELNYAIMDYHGDIRAQGKYGWKKYRGILVPGTFYLMTVDGERTTYRFKKTNGSSVVSANAKQLTPYAKSGDGQDADANWNGVGNPTLTYGKVGYNVYVLNPDPNVYDYELKPANEHNFVVGTPFFIQASASGTMAMDNIDGSKPYYAPARVANKTDKVTIALSNEDYTDYLYISASEDARNEYELGKDLVTMRMSATPRVPRIAAKAYNTELAMIYTPLNNDMATCDLSLYAPANGEYTLSVAESDDEVLLAYDGQPIWNLTADPFVLDLERGTNKHYSLFILPNNAPTDIETIGNGPLTNDVRKVLFNGQLFIIRDGRIYDATGKATK